MSNSKQCKEDINSTTLADRAKYLSERIDNLLTVDPEDLTTQNQPSYWNGVKGLALIFWADKAAVDVGPIGPDYLNFE